MQDVLVTRPLALSEDDPAWVELSRLARVEVSRLEKYARLKTAVGLITMVDDRVDEKLLKRMPRLKVVANHAVGVNNIDLKAAHERGIVVCNTPNVLTNATAELTIALILAAARRFKEGTELIRQSRFKGWTPTFLLGEEISDKTLGIIGLGRIGAAVKAKAEALGMNVISCSPRGGTHSLEQLLRNADFVSIHCPLNEQTRAMLGPKQLAWLKPGAFLINTARGEILDEKALLKALDKNLRGAALDVFHHEPKLAAPLRRHPRVFVLPHVGSATLTARVAMGRLAVRGITEVLSGRSPTNRVI